MKDDNYILTSHRLSQDQVAFLRTLSNASQFIREAISEKRLREGPISKEEKIITLTKQISFKEAEKSKLASAKEYEEAKATVTRLEKQELGIYADALNLIPMFKKVTAECTNLHELTAALKKFVDNQLLQSGFTTGVFYKTRKASIDLSKPEIGKVYEFKFSNRKQDFKVEVPEQEYLKQFDIEKPIFKAEYTSDTREVDRTKEEEFDKKCPLTADDFFKPLEERIYTQLEKKREEMAASSTDLQTNLLIVNAYKVEIFKITSEVEELKKQIIQAQS